MGERFAVSKGFSSPQMNTELAMWYNSSGIVKVLLQKYVCMESFSCETFALEIIAPYIPSYLCSLAQKCVKNAELQDLAYFIVVFCFRFLQS